MAVALRNLNNKKVVILSTVKWGKMRVSKHHYALELAATGNTVFYIEPPDIKSSLSFSIRRSEVYENLFIVTYKPIARGKRFLPNFIHKKLEEFQAKILLKKLNISPYLLISFDPYRFSNLKWFNAKKSIFFAADLYKSSHVPGEVVTADFCLGVSTTIVQLLKQSNENSFFINHGLNSSLVKLGERQLKQQVEKNRIKSITVGYIGNLLISSLDRKAMMDVIQEHCDIKFIFWGQYKVGQDNVLPGSASDTWEFISFLEKCPNVELAGPKNQNELANEITRADVFWLCYDAGYTWAVDGSNSHKILEYLATGRPVVTTFISLYENSDLLYMQDAKDKGMFAEFFKNAIQSLPDLETESLIQKRIRFALSNSYNQRLKEIDNLIA
jgi:glycosyltransferase involved in cell wall biosynthesis